MATRLLQRLDVGDSLRPALLVLLVGMLLHVIDQITSARAGPVPILVTAPLAATLVYRRFRTASTRELVGLVTWGVVGSGLGVLFVYLRVVGGYLPRSMTSLEMVLYDFGMFVWFVLALAVCYGTAAHSNGWRRLAVVLVAPLVQALFALVLTLLVLTGLYA